VKILLLNPPGDKIYLRDYYCSKVSKAGYIYHPVDLLILSGILSEHHEVKVLDAMALRLGFDSTYRRIKSMDIDAVIFLTGAVSWEKDFALLRKIKSEKNVLTIGSGDILLDGGEEWLRKNDFLDAIILDFTMDSILYFLKGDYTRIPNMIVKNGGEIIHGEEVRNRGAIFEIPIPRRDFFPNRRYSFPLNRRIPFATVLTDYGCPFRCSFCVIGTLGYKSRPVNNIMAELDSLDRNGVREIYFDDQTFGALRPRAIEMCRRMIEQKFQFSWSCWSRVDVVDEELLGLMKEAGCHTIMFGAETARNDILAKERKGYTKEDVERTINRCRKLKIRTLATFILGLPGETEKSCLETIEFSKRLGTDFASFNVPVPRVRTNLRKRAIQKGWVVDPKTMDQSGSFAVMGNDSLSLRDIERLKNKAIREFFLRPSYLWKRLINVRTLYELKKLFRGGWAIIINNMSDPFD
jgi:radical SAM superfamily enzyme YgiQ (UPF0313 family)